MAQTKPNDPMAKPLLVVGLIVIVATVSVLLSSLFNTIQRNSLKGEIDTSAPSTTTAAVNTNLAPIGTVKAVDKSAPKEARSGEAVYNAVCASCHGSGVLGAPKVDDKAAWEPRTAQGLDGLLKNATNGIRSMPARGGDPSLTDEELSNAIVYMTGKAGIDLAGQAKSAAPAAGAAAAATAAAQAAPVAQAAATAAQAAPAAASADGEKVYKSLCFSCHDSGVAGAPKVGDKAAWAARIATGKDALYNSSLKGKNAMPAKGGNPSLADADVKSAVDFMVGKSQ